MVIPRTNIPTTTVGSWPRTRRTSSGTDSRTASGPALRGSCCRGSPCGPRSRCTITWRVDPMLIPTIQRICVRTRGSMKAFGSARDIAHCAVAAGSATGVTARRRDVHASRRTCQAFAASMVGHPTDPPGDPHEGFCLPRDPVSGRHTADRTSSRLMTCLTWSSACTSTAQVLPPPALVLRHRPCALALARRWTSSRLRAPGSGGGTYAGRSGPAARLAGFTVPPTAAS